MWNSADMEQTLVGELVVLHRYLGIVFADKVAPCAMGDGIHRRYEHQGGVAFVSVHLHLGVRIRL